MKKKIKLLDCECGGSSCCSGRGIAVFQIVRKGKKMKVCTKCDLSTDKDKKILKYVAKIPAEKLINFDALGALCLGDDIADKKYPFV